MAFTWKTPPLRQWIAVALFCFVAGVIGYIMGGNATYDRLLAEHRICAQ
jgi:hypothetical protein